VPTVTSFKQIKVDPSFNWKSTKVISINVEALNPELDITNTLFVKSESGEVLLTKLHKMNESYTANLTVPLKTTKVIVNFGSIGKTVSINNGSAVINFIKTKLETNMKKIFLFAVTVVLLSVNILNAQTILNGENNNIEEYNYLCWQIPKSINNAENEELVIAGKYSFETTPLNTNTLTGAYIKSPWLTGGTGNVN